jgi:hypothetical protein
MRLTLQRGAAVIAVIAALGTGLTSTAPLATAGEAEARQFMQSGEYDKAVQELMPLADQGSPTAEYLLGEIYLGGHGGDMQQALKWMTASAEQGYAQAQARLGMIYAKGMGVPVNNIEAYRWFSLAAQGADAKSKLKTVSEANRGVIAKRLSPAERHQLAAVKNADEATPEWSRLQKELGTQLDGLVLTVESVDLGTKGIYHRIQAGPFADKSAAAAKCEIIKQMKHDCLVVVRKAQAAS